MPSPPTPTPAPALVPSTALARIRALPTHTNTSTRPRTFNSPRPRAYAFDALTRTLSADPRALDTRARAPKPPPPAPSNCTRPTPVPVPVLDAPTHPRPQCPRLHALNLRVPVLPRRLSPRALDTRAIKLPAPDTYTHVCALHMPARLHAFNAIAHALVCSTPVCQCPQRTRAHCNRHAPLSTPTPTPRSLDARLSTCFMPTSSALALALNTPAPHGHLEEDPLDAVHVVVQSIVDDVVDVLLPELGE
ncbi:hypothetical protein OF83DRAFT_1177938 [Amylostereum chailletii]|nr:hypothetical protein OF83DRAFT_1177938 [Amylostereum chailletii]